MVSFHSSVLPHQLSVSPTTAADISLICLSSFSCSFSLQWSIVHHTSHVCFPSCILRVLLEYFFFYVSAFWVLSSCVNVYLWQQFISFTNKNPHLPHLIFIFKPFDLKKKTFISFQYAYFVGCGKQEFQLFQHGISVWTDRSALVSVQRPIVNVLRSCTAERWTAKVD